MRFTGVTVANDLYQGQDYLERSVLYALSEGMCKLEGKENIHRFILIKFDSRLNYSIFVPCENFWKIETY